VKAWEHSEFLYRVGQTQLGRFWSLITNQSNNTRENGKVPFVVDRWQLPRGYTTQFLIYVFFCCVFVSFLILVCVFAFLPFLVTTCNKGNKSSEVDSFKNIKVKYQTHLKMAMKAETCSVEQRQLNVRPCTIELHADGSITSKLMYTVAWFVCY
jgi:hypothetical protein